MTDESKPPPRPPRFEPEIIPPGATHDPLRAPPFGFDGFARSGFSQRIYVGRIGPFGLLMIALAIAAVFALVVVLLLGAFLLWIPIALLVLAAGVLGGARRYLRRG